MPQSIERTATEIPRIGKLDLYSINKLEALLGSTRDQIRYVANHAGAYYEPFPKKDRIRPFQKKLKPRKKRIIDNPTGKLKDLQKKVQRNLLRPIPLPEYLCGGVKGRTLLDNVTMHLGARVLVTMDIRSFFPSITDKHVYFVWRQMLNCSTRIAEILTKLSTFERHLPQGAPTSTTLANLVLCSLDAPIRSACEQRNVRYSTWVDDLAFSGDSAREIINVAVRALNRSGFAVSHKKTKIMGAGSRKVLTKVLMGCFPTALPERLSQLRSGIHKLRSRQVPNGKLVAYLRSLGGSINQVTSIDPRKGKRLRSELAIVLKDYRDLDHTG
jgi:RNA-directed DNA polymerase